MRNVGTPCFRWCGSYARGKLVYKTHYGAYSPVRIQADVRGRSGYPVSLCGHKDCINLDHHRFIPWAERMSAIHPKARDERGRFVKEDD